MRAPDGVLRILALKRGALGKSLAAQHMSESPLAAEHF
jgi:hypothetical protein